MDGSQLPKPAVAGSNPADLTMKIYLTDGTEFTERTTTMAIDPPIGRLPTADDLKQYSPGPQLLSLEHLTAKLKQAEATAATLPALRAELAERMAAMFPGQRLVKARKAKGGAK